MLQPPPASRHSQPGESWHQFHGRDRVSQASERLANPQDRCPTPYLFPGWLPLQGCPQPLLHRPFPWDALREPRASGSQIYLLPLQPPDPAVFWYRQLGFPFGRLLLLQTAHSGQPRISTAELQPSVPQTGSTQTSFHPHCPIVPVAVYPFRLCFAQSPRLRTPVYAQQNRLSLKHHPLIES